MTILIVLQVVFIWAAVAHVYRLTLQRDGRAPADDIGVLWLGVFAIYATLPTMSWLAQGSSYGPLSARLFLLQPTPREVAYLLWIAVAYVVAFTSVYVVLRKRVSPPDPSAQAFIADDKLAAALVIVVVTYLFGLAMGASGLIGTAESYIDSFRVIYELPRGLRQLLKTVGGIVRRQARAPRRAASAMAAVPAVLLPVRAVDCGHHQSRGRPWSDRGRPAGGRNRLARDCSTLSSKGVLIGGASGLLMFLLLGLWRNFGSLTGANEGEFEGFGVGEFDALWGNAIELLQARETGGALIPFWTRFGELVAFVPAQLLWFDKVSPSDWYLDGFYPGYKEEGGGFVFGAITQAVVGGGVFEAAIRGAILGALAGWIMKWVRAPTQAWWRFPLQLYLLVGVFSGIRETTFIQWGEVVQTWLVAPLAIAMVATLFAKRPVADPEQGTGG